MTTEQYQNRMAALGISRGGFEAGAEIEGTPCGSQLGTNKQAGLLNPDSSTKPEKPPMEELPEHLIRSNALQKTAGKWWAKLSPEERQKHSRKRAANARAQGKKAPG